MKWKKNGKEKEKEFFFALSCGTVVTTVVE